MLCREFVACNCNNCFVEQIANYIDNPIFQELPTKNSDLVLKIELKEALIRKMTLRVWVYSNGKYFYVLGPSGLTLKYKTYTVVRHDEKREAQKLEDNTLKKVFGN